MRRLFLILTPLLLLAAATPGQRPAERQPLPAPSPAADVDHGDDIPEWLPYLAAPTTGPRPTFGWPLRGAISQPFGCTGLAAERGTADCPAGFHQGIDIAQPQGTPIAAAADGVAYAFPNRGRYGMHIIIQHSGGYATAYGHLSQATVGWGAQVRAGQPIGLVGTTGNSTGPHLHFEIRFAGRAMDPAPYLAAPKPDPAVLPAGWPGAPADDWRGVR